MMPLEAEVRGLVLFGYIIICVIYVTSLFILWRRTRNTGLLWFLPQLIFMSVSFYSFYNLIGFKDSTATAMESEMNSLTVGGMGIFWGLSMIFMVIGIVDSVSSIKYTKAR